MTNYLKRVHAVRIVDVIPRMKDILYSQARDLYLEFSHFLIHPQRLILLESLDFVQHVKTALGANTQRYRRFPRQMLLFLRAGRYGQNNAQIRRMIALVWVVAGN